MAYFTRLDVANRALQHLGQPRITAFTDSTKAAREANFMIDKVRRAELQRSVWTFATKRAVMRKVATTTKEVTFLAYSAGTTYGAGDVAADSTGFLWLSTKGTNLAKTPGSESGNPFWVPYFGPTWAQAWSSANAYIPGDVVWVSTAAYLAIATSTNQTPPNATYWQPIAGATVASSVILSPIGYKPDALVANIRNIYRMPANFLRMAPQDPKAAAGARLNETAGMAYNDWEIEEPFLFTTDTDPFVMRFVADQTDVATMHPLFNEVWAARMAIELAEPLTQSPEKIQIAASLYGRYTDAAQLVNAIEAGTTEAPAREQAPPMPQGR